MACLHGEKKPTIIPTLFISAKPIFYQISFRKVVFCVLLLKGPPAEKPPVCCSDWSIGNITPPSRRRRVFYTPAPPTAHLQSALTLLRRRSLSVNEPFHAFIAFSHLASGFDFSSLADVKHVKMSCNACNPCATTCL